MDIIRLSNTECGGEVAFCFPTLLCNVPVKDQEGNRKMIRMDSDASCTRNVEEANGDTLGCPAQAESCLHDYNFTSKEAIIEKKDSSKSEGSSTPKKDK